MTKKEKEAILKMAEELARTSVNNIDFEIGLFVDNDCGLEEFDSLRVLQEALYTHKLKRLAEQVSNIEEDELVDYVFTDFDLAFLKNDFPSGDLLEMVEDAKEESEEEWEEGEAEKIANEICDAIYSCAGVQEALKICQHM